ncbi:MAG: sigma-70 family RNA polymerase sigma factor [Clostridiales bacterium]|nr:sigma-70 family RNA polymerase sigma factor [Clostridiales bacterium]
MLSFLYWLFRDAMFFLGMLSGRGSFPKPLSRQEEGECIARMQAGDEEARKKLIEHNLRLVSHIVRKYTVPGYTRDDLVSVGALGLIKAVNTYKPESGSQLSAYAARCIENEVLMLLRASKKRRGDVSLSDPIGTDGEGNDISFMDILGTDADAVEEEVVQRVSLRRVRGLVEKLPRKERLVIEMRYGLMDGAAHPQHEVAALLGISRSYVSRIEKRAIETLRAGMEGAE